MSRSAVATVSRGSLSNAFLHSCRAWASLRSPIHPNLWLRHDLIGENQGFFG